MCSIFFFFMIRFRLCIWQLHINECCFILGMSQLEAYNVHLSLISDFDDQIKVLSSFSSIWILISPLQLKSNLQVHTIWVFLWFPVFANILNLVSYHPEHSKSIFISIFKSVSGNSKCVFSYCLFLLIFINVIYFILY